MRGGNSAFEQTTLVYEVGATWFRDTRDIPADASKGVNSAVS